MLGRSRGICLYGWQMEARFTPGSLVSWLLFLSWCQLCVKTPSVTTVSQHFGRMVAFCTLASPKMLCLTGPPCKNYHNLGIFLKEGSSTRANLEGLGYGLVLDACLMCTRSWIQSQQYRHPLEKKNPKTQRRANMESIWRAPLLPIWPERSSQGQNNPPTDQSREPRAPNFTQHIPKLLQSQVYFLSRSQNGPASSLG